jgi:t-SNARE complex subunit (syntaxin)
VIEIASIMKELDIMVNEQGESLDLIGDRIEESGTKVVEAKGHLQTAEKYDKGSRILICMILGIVACVTLAVCIGIIILLRVLTII